MEQRICIPNTELAVHPIGLGTAAAGLKYDGKEADYLFDMYLDLGGNLLDTARVYSDWVAPEAGRSERVIGDWLKRGRKRSQVLIATKGGHPDMRVAQPNLHNNRMKQEDMNCDLELSLRTLRTDYIDLYFYHRDNENQPVEDLIEAMEGFVKAGKIRYYACSNWSTERMKEADNYCKQQGYRGFVANQVLYNVGYRYMMPFPDDTMRGLDAEMAKYHRDTTRNLVMAYMGACGGFFHKYIGKGPEVVVDSPYYTEENRKMVKRIEALTKKYGISITQAVLGFFQVQEFACASLYAPAKAEELLEAMKTLEIPFKKADYLL